MNKTLISLYTLLFLAFAFLPTSAHAEIKIINISGESFKKNFIPSGDNSTLQIFGGFAGDEADCDRKDNVATCNNCPTGGTTFKVCNRQRAYVTLKLQVTFTSTSIAPAGPASRFIPKIEPVITGTGSIATMDYDKTPSEVTTANQQATIGVTWRELCENVEDPDILDADKATCNIQITQGFRIGFDSATDGLTEGSGDDSTTISINFSSPSNDFANVVTDPAACTTGGICNFTLAPGDEKAIIGNTGTITAPGSNAQPSNVLLYCDETTDFTQVTQNTPTAVIPVVSGGIIENKLSGFKNGVTYSCHAAVQDEAGNIGLFFKAGATGCPTGTPANICRQVTPDSVIGLFSEDTNCFIATAAYGSPFESQVKLLREFRNKYLLTNTVGRTFVRFYYAVSPPIARWIALDPHRKQVTRAALTPVVWGVSVFMNWSWILGVAVLFGCGLIAFRRKFL